jgi:hypothetical protein
LGLGFGNRAIEHPSDLIDLDMLDSQALQPAAFPTDEFDRCLGHAEQLGYELDAGDVGATIDRWRRDPDVEGVTSPARDGGPTGTGVDVETKKDRRPLRSPLAFGCLALLKLLDLEQVLGHGRIL